MGFFLSDQGSDILKKIAILFAERVTDLGKFYHNLYFNIP